MRWRSVGLLTYDQAMHRKIPAFATIIIGLSLTGCSAPGAELASPEATESSDYEPLTVESATPSPMPTPSPTETRSDRGNLVFRVGDDVSLSDYSGADWATLRLEKVSSKVKCTEPYQEPVAKGNKLVAMTFSAKTEASPSGDADSLWMGAFAWKFYDDNGVTYNGELSSDATYYCFPEKKMLPSEMGPGEKATGVVLVEVPDLKGTVAHEDFGIEFDLATALKESD